MTEQHPITPPPELVRQWRIQIEYCSTRASRETLLAQIFAAGADQELEACCAWMLANARFLNAGWIERLRTARRPEPPSLKEQALGALYAIATGADDTREFHQDLETIKTALEQLDD
jgi:hypothetical protein